jgi:hypothetical protein
MQRRKFIKNTLAGLPLIFLAPSLLANSCSSEDETETPNGKSVIVIGAGISGLAAAKKLKEKGFEVTVLEAQEKVGGRLKTNRSLGIPFDEGASWIHGINGNPITNLAQQAGMQTFETVDDSRKSYDIGGILRSNTVFDNTETEYYNILSTLKNSGNPAQSFQAVFKIYIRINSTTGYGNFFFLPTSLSTGVIWIKFLPCFMMRRRVWRSRKNSDQWL